MSVSPGGGSPDRVQERRRRRTAHACDACRSRKTRCDGQQPCTNCSKLSIHCTFVSEAPPKGKSDLILNAILRVEQSIGRLDDRLSYIVDVNSSPSAENAITSPGTHSSAFSRRTHPSAHQLPSMRDVENATISALHTSTTESILAWPHIDAFPSLRLEEGSSIFHLEHSRPPLAFRKTQVHPYASAQAVIQQIQQFQRSVGFFYPFVSTTQLHMMPSTLSTVDLDDSTQSCLALLVMALGSASNALASKFPHDNQRFCDSENSEEHHTLSYMYFDAAIKRLYQAHLETTPQSAQCLLLTALYHNYLQRPLEAWSLMNSAATKCRVILSYKVMNMSTDEEECVRRMFWSCYILESDYLAELAALPQCGLAEIESSVPLPGRFSVHDDDAQDELSSLYFLACISMRRLLNRAHHLLFAKDSGVNLDDTRYPKMVNELNLQLDMWRDLLPHAFRFSFDTQPVQHQAGAFLRQRYLTCKALIYRPYLVHALVASSRSDPLDPVVMERCKICLDSCIMHILNLGNFMHTMMLDTWICALS